METFFDLLENEPDAAVRVVLGHFVFVYIHPYSDGKWKNCQVLDEPDVGIRWLPMDSDSC